MLIMSSGHVVALISVAKIITLAIRAYIAQLCQPQNIYTTVTITAEQPLADPRGRQGHGSLQSLK